MTKDEIIKLAREAGLVEWLPNSTFSDGIWWIDAHEPGSELLEFASLVIQQERERCAKVCELTSSDMNPMAHWAANECARLIKTRETQNLWGGVDFDINTKRPWIGLSETDFLAINQSCLTKLQAATSAESILKEKNS